MANETKYCLKLSKNPTITDGLVDEVHSDKPWDWSKMSQNLTKEDFENHDDKPWDWNTIKEYLKAIQLEIIRLEAIRLEAIRLEAIQLDATLPLQDMILMIFNPYKRFINIT